MFSLLNINTIISAIVISILAFFGYDYYSAKQAEKAAKAAVTAIETTKENNDVVNNLVKKSDKERTKLNTIVSSNESIVVRLQQPTKTGGNTSSKACASEANKISAYQEVFGECTRRLTEVAEAADEHAIDADTYMKAFLAVK